MRAHIPNTITLFNLFFGCCALLLVLSGRPDLAVWFMFGCFACDSADGFVARALKVDSPLGKQLDSLADVVSFGVVPGVMLYTLLLPPGTVQFAFYVPALPAFVLSMFAAYRLGKFNLDTRQTSYFLGLSTPAATIFVLGLTLANYNNRFGLQPVLAANPWLIYLIVALLSWLMVSELPLAGMKFKGLRWKGNEALLFMLVLFGVMLFWVKELAFCVIILVYIFYSVSFKNKVTAG